jgi:hypothetical protein
MDIARLAKMPSSNTKTSIDGRVKGPYYNVKKNEMLPQAQSIVIDSWIHSLIFLFLVIWFD